MYPFFRYPPTIPPLFLDYFSADDILFSRKRGPSAHTLNKSSANHFGKLRLSPFFLTYSHIDSRSALRPIHTHARHSKLIIR